MNTSIGNSIQEARKNRGLTHEQLAASVNIGESTIYRIESGSHRPTLKTLKKLCDFLELDFLELMNLGEYTERNKYTFVRKYASTFDVTLNPVSKNDALLIQLFSNSLSNMSEEDKELTKLFLSSLSSLSEKEKEILKVLLSQKNC